MYKEHSTKDSGDDTPHGTRATGDSTSIVSSHTQSAEYTQSNKMPIEYKIHLSTIKHIYVSRSISINHTNPILHIQHSSLLTHLFDHYSFF